MGRAPGGQQMPMLSAQAPNRYIFPESLVFSTEAEDETCYHTPDPGV